MEKTMEQRTNFSELETKYPILDFELLDKIKDSIGSLFYVLDNVEHLRDLSHYFDKHPDMRVQGVKVADNGPEEILEINGNNFPIDNRELSANFQMSAERHAIEVYKKTSELVKEMKDFIDNYHAHNT